MATWDERQAKLNEFTTRTTNRWSKALDDLRAAKTPMEIERAKAILQEVRNLDDNERDLRRELTEEKAAVLAAEATRRTEALAKSTAHATWAAVAAASAAALIPVLWDLAKWAFGLGPCG